jgi:hypothetical protein
LYVLFILGLKSACSLHSNFLVAERVGVHVVECACVIELLELKVCP